MRIKNRALFAFLLTSLLTSCLVQAKESQSSGDLKSEIKEYINHHLRDSHDFNLFSYTSNSNEHIYVGIPLPVLLWDNGLKVFSSSKLKHGEGVANVNGNHYRLYPVSYTHLRAHETS